MWKGNAQLFYWISTALQRLHITAKIHIDKHGLNKKAAMGANYQAELLKQCRTLSDEVGVLGARLTLITVDRFVKQLEEGKIRMRS
jgi:nicotinic acid phosphoribosyltransferase